MVMLVPDQLLANELGHRAAFPTSTQMELQRTTMKILRKLLAYARRRDIPVEKSIVKSEYLNWLRFANAGMMNNGNVRSMFHAIQNLPSDAPIVEIGSFCGLSTNIMTYFKERLALKNKLITCDRWKFEGAEADVPLGDSEHVMHSDYREYVKDSYIRNISIFSRYDMPYTVELFSDEFFDAWNEQRTEEDVVGRPIELGGPISFCFVDGNHSYEYAKRDFENADRHLETNGFILFDDSGDATDWEVCRVVKEVQKSSRYELVARNPNYLFKKVA